MKSLIVGLVVAGLALSVNASDSHAVKVQSHEFSPFIPMCPPGEVATLVKVNGIYRWECLPG
ncbi:hypothetical protein [Dyella mobilis]|uniref:Uncharacterized protein n=1 Tax=Dyella mobilis TaxID=1849582 RepID=A0ABS2KCP6_9GAMM|nr:hypothetical protein [Dyella mobilis]MBM7128951.1 hypothetical protein [Dyella mobilis]GLQ99359.1 hypothetical protein GCM10007863_37790 [Dyella mobilis]